MIKFIALILIGLVLTLAPVIAQAPSTGSIKAADGSKIDFSAAKIAGLSSLKLIMTGDAHVKRVSKAPNTTFEANGAKITLVFLEKTSVNGTTPGIAGIKSVEIAGPVKMVYVTNDPTSGNKTTTTVTGNSATYNGTTQLAHINGNVKLVSDNPAVFESPGIMTGESAVVNLKPILGEDEFRFEIQGSPSRIELTPKEKVNNTK